MGWYERLKELRAQASQAKSGDWLSFEEPEELRRLALAQTVYPWREVQLNNQTVRWRYALPECCTWTERHDTADDYLIFVTSCCRQDMIVKAVSSVAPTGQNVLIVDGIADERHPWTFPDASVLRCPDDWTFTQAMNAAIVHAQLLGKRWFVYIHGDMESLDREIVGKLLNHARQREDQKVGIWLTHYDLVACYDLKAVQEVGYVDATFWNYFQDCDYHRRLRLAAWGVVDSPFPGPFLHHGSYAVREFGPRKAAWVGHGGQDWHGAHYIHKWGGPPGNETNSTPYRL